MKKVVDASTVAHLWAHQTQEEARVPGNGNFYFRGDTIYSYGSHFPIARHITNKKGERAVLFTTRGYSHTTAKHLSIVRSAVSHLNVIRAYRPDMTAAENFSKAEEEIKNALQGLGTARKPEKYINPAEYILNQSRAYAEFLGVKLPKTLIKLVDSAKSGKYGAYLLKEAKRIEKERIEKEARVLAANIEGLKKWRQGKGPSNIGGRFEDQDYVRYNWRKKRIETSQGVEIPVEIARRAYNWILGIRKAGGCAGECKYKILEYEVSEVTEDFIKIGCHKILHSESENIAKKLGWVK